jgi:nitroimidazol reductase NimA-like FMN-containing flavoprotein (pyridoxamine 5'-phosphate oxidase superfamily)
MTDTEKIYEFIKSHNLAVISTVTHDFLPQSAVVGFSEKENLELIFGTSNKSRKYQNLLKNPRVSFVIGSDQGKTVQYEGEAVELKGQPEWQEAINLHLSKIPSAVKFLTDSEEAVFKVIPKWIKYTDLSRDPWDIIELRF